MEIEIREGHYKFRAVLIDRTQPKPWICTEWTNVGLESEGKASQWIDSLDNILYNVAQVLGKEE